MYEENGEIPQSSLGERVANPLTIYRADELQEYFPSSSEEGWYPYCHFSENETVEHARRSFSSVAIEPEEKLYTEGNDNQRAGRQKQEIEGAQLEEDNLKQREIRKSKARKVLERTMDNRKSDYSQKKIENSVLMETKQKSIRALSMEFSIRPSLFGRPMKTIFVECDGQMTKLLVERQIVTDPVKSEVCTTITTKFVSKLTSDKDEKDEAPKGRRNVFRRLFARACRNATNQKTPCPFSKKEVEYADKISQEWADFRTSELGVYGPDTFATRLRNVSPFNPPLGGRNAQEERERYLTSLIYQSTPSRKNKDDDNMSDISLTSREKIIGERYLKKWLDHHCQQRNRIKAKKQVMKSQKLYSSRKP